MRLPNILGNYRFISFLEVRYIVVSYCVCVSNYQIMVNSNFVSDPYNA